jgi:hypothetical protein
LVEGLKTQLTRIGTPSRGCPFAGLETIRAAYRHAIAQRYRFYSYGDAMVIL